MAIVGLALSHVLGLTGMLQWWVRQTTEVENAMTSVERLLEYTALPQEPPRCVVDEGGCSSRAAGMWNGAGRSGC